jgi:hypothetical protein
MQWRPEVQYEAANDMQCSTGPCTSLKLEAALARGMNLQTNTASDFEGVTRMDTASHAPKPKTTWLGKKAMLLTGTPIMWQAWGKEPTLLNANNKAKRTRIGTCPHQTHTCSLGCRHNLLHII